VLYYKWKIIYLKKIINKKDFKINQKIKKRIQKKQSINKKKIKKKT